MSVFIFIINVSEKGMYLKKAGRSVSYLKSFLYWSYLILRYPWFDNKAYRMFIFFNVRESVSRIFFLFGRQYIVRWSIWND